jgi:hypothetical protein
MPDKRDMHQAKSHRNSRTKQQSTSPADRGAPRPPTAAPAPGSPPAATFAAPEVAEQVAAPTGRKNKSRR